MKGIAHKNSKTPSQVLLRWGLQSGVSVMPKSTDARHMQVGPICLHCLCLLSVCTKCCCCAAKQRAMRCCWGWSVHTSTALPSA